MPEENEKLTPEQAVKKIQERLDEKMEGVVSKKDLEGIKDDIKTLKEKTEKDAEIPTEIKEALSDLEGKYEALKEKGGKSEEGKGTLADAIVGAMKDNIDAIKGIAEKGGLMNLDVKAPATMTTGNYTGGTVGLSDLQPGVTRIQRRRTFMRSIVNSGGTNSKYVVYVEQQNADPGEAGMTAEGAAKTQTDFDLVEVQKRAKKVTAFIKVSKEMIADIPFIQGEINGELMELVELKLDKQILSGDGTGENLEGVENSATAWSAGNFAGTIGNANEHDVLRVAIANIANANFSANYILMNPEDTASMEMTKTTDGEYVYPMFYRGENGQMRVKNIPIIENPGVTAGDFVVGDFTKSNLRMREDMNIQVGYVNDDFTKNLMTILCEARAVHYIKSNHTGAFIKGTFSTAITALEPV